MGMNKNYYVAPVPNQFGTGTMPCRVFTLPLINIKINTFIYKQHNLLTKNLKTALSYNIKDIFAVTYLSPMQNNKVSNGNGSNNGETFTFM